MMIVEVLCHYKYSAQIAFFKDIDHRLEPNTHENNADGIRSQKQSQDFKPEDFNIIFLGDSFVYGLGVPPQFAIPQQFESIATTRHPEMSINVANFGWISSSPYLSLRLLKDIGSKYHPDVIFLCIDMTDFHDDVVYTYLLEKPTLTYKAITYIPGIVLLFKDILEHYSSHPTLNNMYEKIFGVPNDRYFIAHQPLGQTEKYCRPIIDSINNTYEYATHTLKAKFILTIFPRSFHYSNTEDPHRQEAGAYEVVGPYIYEPFKLFEQLQKNVPYPVYSLLQHFLNTDVFPTCFADDPHWNENGNRVAAEGLYDIAQQEQIFE